MSTPERMRTRGSTARQQVEQPRHMIESAEELLAEVFSRLDSCMDVGSAAQVSRAWRDVARRDSAWECAARSVPLLARIKELAGTNASSWRGLLLRRAEAHRVAEVYSVASSGTVAGPREAHEHFTAHFSDDGARQRQRLMVPEPPVGTVWATPAMVLKNDAFRRFINWCPGLYRLAGGRAAVEVCTEIGTGRKSVELVRLKDVRNLEQYEKSIVVYDQHRQLPPLQILDPLHGRGKYLVGVEICSSARPGPGACVLEELSAAAHSGMLLAAAPGIQTGSWDWTVDVLVASMFIVRRSDGSKTVLLDRVEFDIETISDGRNLCVEAVCWGEALKIDNAAGLPTLEFEIEAELHQSCDIGTDGVSWVKADLIGDQSSVHSVDELLHLLESPALACRWVHPSLASNCSQNQGNGGHGRDLLKQQRMSLQNTTGLLEKIEEEGLLSKILQHLSAKDLTNAGEVSRSWHRISCQDDSWGLLVADEPRFALAMPLQSMQECTVPLKELCAQSIAAAKAATQPPCTPDLSAYMLGIELFDHDGRLVFSALESICANAAASSFYEEDEPLCEIRMEPDELLVDQCCTSVEMTAYLIRKRDTRCMSLFRRQQVGTRGHSNYSSEVRLPWSQAAGGRFPPATLAVETTCNYLWQSLSGHRNIRGIGVFVKRDWGWPGRLGRECLDRAGLFSLLGGPGLAELWV